MLTATVESSASSGRFVQIAGEDYYEIENYDAIRPFLMSIVSSGDHWLYISSGGGLTAGRVCAERCLFPYETVDRLHDSHPHNGPLTLVRRRDAAGNVELWRPFADGMVATAPGARRLLKHISGDEVVFEETHEAWGLTFRYSWRTSRRFGFVRTSSLTNHGEAGVHLEIVDGFQNVCPSGLSLATHQQASCLADAYKLSEVEPSTKLGIFSLTAQILDRAEAAEVLRTTTVWTHGLPDATVFLTAAGLRKFCRGDDPKADQRRAGQRSNYLVFAPIELAAGETQSWHLAADVHRDHQQVAWTRRQLMDSASLDDALRVSLAADRLDLRRNIASADGLQATNSRMATAHHQANVLFNNMRGGVFPHDYRVESADFLKFVAARNRDAYQAGHSMLRNLPGQIDYGDLLAAVRQDGDSHLLRLTLEYLPLTFGRRHGDPSRPWNAFEIRVREDDGSIIYNYQGNWRDIFQNWEALGRSFPAFLPSFVAKFLNASTIDGFNPYRLTRDGVDWEIPDPEDPWSNIGYWGDHQIIYLAKLIEATREHAPGCLEQMFDEAIFGYANVPYRIRPFENVVVDSKKTIDFDRYTAQEVQRRVGDLGADGKLVLDAQGAVYHVNLVEKLLVPVLAKLSNLVVDGGIWLNTQRPEWNDANNALVGPGLSMVTVCYLRRHLELLIDMLRQAGDRRFSLSVEVEQWFRGIRTVYQDNLQLLNEATISDQDRGRILQELGRAFSDYRLKVYEDGFSGKHTVGGNELIEFFRVALEYLDHSIRSNRRDDCLYHAYNLLDLNASGDSAEINRLYVMLEGQVAVLSSGLLDAGQALELIDAMFDSQLYRDDQRTFMLYPHRDLPGFLARNQVPGDAVQAIPLLRNLVDQSNRSLIVRDAFGEFHFAPQIQRAVDLNAALDALAADQQWSDAVDADRGAVSRLFDEVFGHKTYTGRSGAMYGYEGLGCVYWHMVSKLLLAVQENVFAAVDRQAPKAAVEALADAYFLVRGGLSADKSPAEYGAFPADPYSHTPLHAGAQQPGMTGQVKEEVLARFGELGVRVRDGRMVFEPSTLLRRREFFTDRASFSYIPLAGEESRLDLPAGSLAFTICQTPVVYQLVGDAFRLRVTMADGAQLDMQDGTLDQQTTREVFDRTGKVERIDVYLPDAAIVRA